MSNQFPVPGVDGEDSYTSSVLIKWRLSREGIRNSGSSRIDAEPIAAIAMALAACAAALTMSTLLTVMVAIVIGYLAASFLQMIFHRWLGHVPSTGFFFRRHVFDHHRIYSPTHLVYAKYSEKERSLTPYYALPSAVAIWLSGLALPRAPLLGFATTIVASYAAHTYLHKHYHLEQTWLNRWGWFRRRRELHYVHHRNTGCNFAVIDFFWDRLFGTFAAPTAAGSHRSAK